MSFASWTLPEILVVAALCCAILVSLSLIRKRRRSLEVPFPELWQQVLNEKRPRQARRRRRVLVDLLLYLLAALSALAGVSTLHCPREQHAAPTVLHLVDRSASMAHGQRWTELQQALQQELAQPARAGTSAAVLAVGHDVDLVRAPATPEVLTRDELEVLRPRPVEADFATAIATAERMIESREAATIRVHSDGALDAASLSAITDCVQRLGRRCSVHWVGQGKSPSNTAITGVAASRLPNDDARIRVRTQLYHDSQLPRNVELIYRGTAGRELARHSLELNPGQRRSDEVEFHRLVDPYIEVELQAGESGPDFDDRAYAVVPPARPRKVALVSADPPLFLEAALLSAGPAVELQHHSPTELLAAPEKLEAADLVILMAPSEALLQQARVANALQTRHLLIFAPPTGEKLDSTRRRALGIRQVGRIDAPRIDGGERRHAIVDGVHLGDINIARSVQLVPGRGDLVLASDASRPLILFRPGPPMRLIFGFSPAQSDLPLRVAFPVLIANLLSQSQDFAAVQHRPHAYAGHVDIAGERLSSYGQGQGLRLRALRESYASAGSVVGQLRAPRAGTALVFRPPGLGVYELSHATAEPTTTAPPALTFAVNLGSEQASSVQSRFSTEHLGRVDKKHRPHQDPEPTLHLRPLPTWQGLLCLCASLLALAWRMEARRR